MYDEFAEETRLAGLHVSHLIVPPMSAYPFMEIGQGQGPGYCARGIEHGSPARAARKRGTRRAKSRELFKRQDRMGESTEKAQSRRTTEDEWKLYIQKVGFRSAIESPDTVLKRYQDFLTCSMIGASNLSSILLRIEGRTVNRIVGRLDASARK